MTAVPAPIPVPDAVAPPRVPGYGTARWGMVTLILTEAEGRLGVAQSIRGRVHDLGGTVAITGTPGEGTEVELRVPRQRTVR